MWVMKLTVFFTLLEIHLITHSALLFGAVNQVTHLYSVEMCHEVSETHPVLAIIQCLQIKPLNHLLRYQLPLGRAEMRVTDMKNTPKSCSIHSQKWKYKVSFGTVKNVRAFLTALGIIL